MNKAINFLVGVEEFISRALLVCVVFLVFFAAVGRWFGLPVAWSVNIAQLLFVWIIFLGANQALRNDKHIGVDILTSRFPDKLQKLIALGVFVLVSAFLAFIIVRGVSLSIDNASRTISNTSISYSYITMAVPVGCLLMLATTLRKVQLLVANIRLQRHGEPLESSDDVGY
ncbi:TRAP transporter small permease [Halomonas sp. ML-15]|uniref:TRAP transporter small permease n=1 Tax=Halomonas sp. ML-15 TaxID=2773305 RepID=UPI00174643C9|nr:TRAP transporter small permease [Halomonas sp. ML-15]MBD3895300.1 TRAP transporter small permease [Halomonas sp. ML-15]